MTPEKVYPDNIDGSDIKAWTFYGFSKSGSSYRIEEVGTYFANDTMAGRCVQDIDNLKINVDGLSYDLKVGESKRITLDTATIKGYLWRFNNKLYTSKVVDLVGNTRRGCDNLEAWVNTMNNRTVYSCQVIYTVPNVVNSEYEPDFNLEKVSNLSVEYKAARVSSIYFDRAQAPITPKYDGGYYMLYTDYTTSMMHVVEFNKNDEVVQDFNSAYKAYPMDILETDYGFAIYARYVSDPHHSFVVTYNWNYTKRVETTIMNNGGELPTVLNEALVFYDSTGTALFGTNLMFEPENGKLAFGRGRLNIIFAHYNNFGDDGGHTGDTYYSLDLDGSNLTAKYAWGWKCSHSLIQSHIYNGRYFVSASLGDAYPENIDISVIDNERGNSAYDSKRKSYPNIQYKNTQEIAALIPGNHIGDSMGRLGAVLDFGDYFGLIYSVKKSENDNRDGIFFLTFKYVNDEINLLTTKTIISNVCSSMINLRAARYGKEF